jgi:hypothetical protein
MRILGSGMRRIYQGLRTGATFILLTSPALAGAPCDSVQSTASLWSQPTGLAAGDRFLALGYGRGVELWDWPADSVPVRNSRQCGAAVTALWAGDSTLFWCAADSALHAATLSASGWSPETVIAVGEQANTLSGSPQYVALVTGTSHVRFAQRPVVVDGLRDWQPPDGRPLAYLSVRDSTAAVAGADHAFLLRLRPSGAELIDSLPLGAFVQALQWAGDSLYMAFGFSGLRMAPTQGDRFTGTLSEWASQGTFSQLVLTNTACAGLDFFGRMEIFQRGTALSPAARLAFDGTPRTATGRGDDIVLLTVEHGLALLNLFTLESPFWSYHAVLPGFVRDLEWSPEGVLAIADFSGVYRLGTGEDLIVNHPYNAVSLDVEWPNLAATSLLGGVAIASLTSPESQPYAVLPTRGWGRRSEITGDRLWVAGDGICDTGLTVYRLAPPDEPGELQRLAVCGSLVDMAAGPGVVAVALRDSGVQIFDAYAPESGPLAVVPPGELWDGLVWQGYDLWARHPSDELIRWRWNGTTLTELDRFAVPGARTFDVWGSTLAVSTAGGVAAFTWQPGGTLVPLAVFDTRHVVTCILLHGDTIWAADRDAVIRLEFSGSAAVAEPEVRPESALLDRPYPNPFNGDLVLTLHLNRGAWSVAVVDLLGRIVKRWQGVAVTDRVHRLLWSPGEEGAAPSGVYLVRAENAGERTSRKVVYLK